MSKKKKQNSITQEEKWIKEWKKCKCSELADSFHCIPKKEEPILTRCTAFYLSKKRWQRMMEQKLPNLRIHMAIKRKKGKTPTFIPIIQNFDKESKKEGPYVSFREEIPITLSRSEISEALKIEPPITHFSSEISEALKKELVKNWLYLHPGYIVDQFETVEEEIGPESRPGNPRSIEKLIRQRVNYYFYDEKDVLVMNEISDKLDYVVFHMAVNHNDDRFGIPSFTPVLQFLYDSSQSDGRKKTTIEPASLFFEFASPCPNLCP